jgi:hypothetical protein
MLAALPLDVRKAYGFLAAPSKYSRRLGLRARRSLTEF